MVRKDFEVRNLIQVCYDLDEGVEKREIGSLPLARRGSAYSPAVSCFIVSAPATPLLNR